MSTAPSYRIQLVQAEVRQLERSGRTLEECLRRADDADRQAATSLAAALKKITDKTFAAVPDPDDRAIPKGITHAVGSLFTAATKAVSDGWARIRELIGRALARTRDELARKQAELRRLEGELLRQQQSDRARRTGTGHDGGPGTGGGSAGGSPGSG